ncbi:hypothetical protein ANO11243_049710 [Dothideomycetidae sp. 11243]|nr:hypothetical protein ANO11243_049710 [fungal sp. No.11243]
MASKPNAIHVRGASSERDDVDFVVAAWDSTLPYLDFIGAGEMWGTQPFSEQEGFRADIVDVVQQTEAATGLEGRQLLVAEVDDVKNTSERPIRVGAAMFRDTFSSYLTEREELHAEVAEAESYVWIEALISDYRYASRPRGVGAALIDEIKRLAGGAGKRSVYVDAWAGNERKLNR